MSDEFDDFLDQSDEQVQAGLNGRPGFDPVNASDAEMQAFIDGKPPLDVEAVARQMKAQKDARELEEFRQHARQNMAERGFDFETGTWKKPEPSTSEPEPALVMDSLSDQAFEDLIAARDEARMTGRDLVYERETDRAQVQAAFEHFTTGRGPDVEAEAEEDDSAARWGDQFFLGERR